MKDHVEIGHLTKYDAFRTNRDQVMELEIWFKILKLALTRPSSLMNFGTANRIRCVHLCRARENTVN